MTERSYSLAEVRDGTGWPRGARFVLVDDDRSEADDTSSSASRQHFIDTGRYLTVEDVEEYDAESVWYQDYQDLEREYDDTDDPDTEGVWLGDLAEALDDFVVDVGVLGFEA